MSKKKKSSLVSAVDRRTRAIERKTVRDALTPRQQLAILDQRLGKGVGAVRERARLEKLVVADMPEPEKVSTKKKKK